MRTQTKIALIVALLAGAVSLQANVTANWAKNCVSCHGKDGRGQTIMGKKVGARDYTDPKVQESFTDEEAFKIIKEGLTKGGKEIKKGFADKLSDEEIKALIAHVRKFKK